MADETDLITPKEEDTPEVTPEEETKGKSGLPDELLKIPAMQGLMAGSPGAVSLPIASFEKRPEAQLLVKHKPELLAAGLGFYRSLSGDLGAVFNQLYVHGEDLQAADKAGKLQEVAPPFDVVNSEIAKSGANNPVLNHAGPPSAPKAAPIPQPTTSSGMVKQPSAAAQKKSLTSKITNLQPGPPTSGATPGAGRLLNSILKPVL